MYVLFEGIDRAGKSTQIELLRQKFPDAIITKEPGGTQLGQKIRDLVLHSQNPSPYAELFLFLADRAEHVAKVIRPNRDKLLISDRGYISGIAYAAQKVGLSVQELKRLNTIAMQGVLPDKIVFLELSEKELKNRMGAYTLDNIEARGIGYLLQVQNMMKKLIISSTIAYRIIDASLPKERIAQEIEAFIKDSDGD